MDTGITVGIEAEGDLLLEVIINRVAVAEAAGAVGSNLEVEEEEEEGGNLMVGAGKVGNSLEGEEITTTITEIITEVVADMVEEVVDMVEEGIIGAIKAMPDIKANAEIRDTGNGRIRTVVLAEGEKEKVDAEERESSYHSARMSSRRINWPNCTVLLTLGLRPV